MEKTYLGDSVYADVGHFALQVKLTTENGEGPSNTIYLDPEVLDSLMRYRAAWLHEMKEQEAK